MEYPKLTVKEEYYLKDSKMFQNKLDSGGYITVNSYLTRGNLNEHINLMRKSVRENKNCFKKSH